MSYSAFFYGTLLHPFILRRVIGHHGDDLKICPALLLEHTRHQVKMADYPGVIPYGETVALLDLNKQTPELSPEERTVRGSLVQGLNESDIALLDVFEGDEYTRVLVSVHPLGPLTPLATASAEIVPASPPPVPALATIASTHPPAQAHTYIWTKGLQELKPEVWEFAEFVKKNAWKWIGDGQAVRENRDYLEVDKRRDMGGTIVRREIVHPAGKEEGAREVMVDIE